MWFLFSLASEQGLLLPGQVQWGISSQGLIAWPLVCWIWQSPDLFLASDIKLCFSFDLNLMACGVLCISSCSDSFKARQTKVSSARENWRAFAMEPVARLPATMLLPRPVHRETLRSGWSSGHAMPLGALLCGSLPWMCSKEPRAARAGRFARLKFNERIRAVQKYTHGEMSEEFDTGCFDWISIFRWIFPTSSRRGHYSFWSTRQRQEWICSINGTEHCRA